MKKNLNFKSKSSTYYKPLSFWNLMGQSLRKKACFLLNVDSTPFNTKIIVTKMIIEKSTKIIKNSKHEKKTTYNRPKL